MKKAFVIGTLLVVLTLSLGGSAVSKVTDNAATYEQLRLFTEVLSIVQNQYVDEVPPKDLIYNAIKGTLRGLDPHSSFLDPESYREMQVETSGSFGGLGIEITLKDDILTVVAPIDGTPAYRAGLHTGDRIVKIDGLSTKDMQLADAVKRMRGKPGTKVTISIVREGWTEPKDFDIVREQIRVQSVRAVELGDGIEYLKLRQFQEQSPHDLEAQLEKFSKGGMKALILDLRNNPGGLLTAAVEVSEKFIDDGKLVVYTEGRVRNQNMRFSAHPKKGYAQMPMVVLVNRRQRLGLRDRGRCAPGLGPGDDRGHPDVRQGLGADHHPAVGWLRAPADHGEVLHAEGALDPRQGHHARRRDRRAEGDDAPQGAAVAVRRSAGGPQEGRAAAEGYRSREDDADRRFAPTRWRSAGGSSVAAPVAVAELTRYVRRRCRPGAAAPGMTSPLVFSETRALNLGTERT